VFAGEEKRLAVQMALRSIGKTESVFQQVHRIGELLPELGAEYYPLFLDLVTQINHDYSQANVLREAAEHLPSEYFERAFAIAKSIKSGGARTQALCSLLSNAPEPLLEHLYSEVIRISDKSERARCLLALGKRLAAPARASAARIALEDIVSSEAPRMTRWDQGEKGESRKPNGSNTRSGH
jgi:hypothetical protein